MTDEKQTNASGEDQRAVAARLRRELFDDELVDRLLEAANSNSADAATTTSPTATENGSPPLDKA